MSYNLFLDDVRDPSMVANYAHWSLRAMYRLDKWNIVRSYEEFVAYIEEFGLPEVISFDHDLSEEHYAPESEGWVYVEKTGLDCAKWLCEYCDKNEKELPEWYIHSMNPVGAENIRKQLENYETRQDRSISM